MKIHGNPVYRAIYAKDVMAKDIPKLSHSIRSIIKKSIENKLITNPIEFGKPLRYSLKGHRRLRVGDYRVVYRIEKLNVIILGIKHRKDIYINQ